MIKKLQSNKGATFIIALIYFLICMMVGASMITAAAADRGRIVANVNEQRAYFLVSSAANTFKDKLINAKYTDSYDYYNAGDSTEYEKAITRREWNRFDEDVGGKPICPMPNERFSDGHADHENINKPEIDISGMEYAEKREHHSDELEDIYNTFALYARDIFYNEIGKMSEARSKYHYNHTMMGHSFEATMTLEGSAPIKVKYTMVEDGDRYSELDTYDVYIEFKNDTTGTNDKEYCVTLLLKATKGSDTPTNQTVNFTVTRQVTDASGTHPADVPEYVEIETIPLELKWDKAEIIMGSLE